MNPGASSLSRSARAAMLWLFVTLCFSPPVKAANSRSGYIPYDETWTSSPDFRLIAFDAVHQQIFTGWPVLDRIDVLSAADYHLIHSITVPSPSSLDISPDGTTLAVGTSSSHILFFDTGTFAKTNDVLFADSALGIRAFVYTANGNAIIRAAEGLSTGGGITAYWNHLANSFSRESNALKNSGSYQTNGPLARSGDYSRIMLGDATSGGTVQIVDGSTGDIIQQLSYGGYIYGLAANNNASRYAVCVNPAGAGDFLVILDGSFNELYQDDAGCLGMTFSADGGILYRDVGDDPSGNLSTQSLDMTTFTAHDTTNQYRTANSYSTFWEAADSTGMVYGLDSNIPKGVAFTAVDTTLASTPRIPTPADSVHIVRIIDNIGSQQGGDIIRILCTEADTGNPSVTIGGNSGSVVSVGLPGAYPTLPNLRIVTVKTPPGMAGPADVTLTTGSGSDTAANAFQYARVTKLFPFSTSPNFLLYDPFRQKLYAAHKDQVEVIDPVAQQVLAPLVPASGKPPNSQFAGLSLSPDGSRLYIADAGADLIHVLDLNSPGTGTSIDPAKAIGSSSQISPARVFETASGRLVGSDAGGTLFVIDSGGASGSRLLDSMGHRVTGFAWNSTNKGKYVFINGSVDGLISSTVGLWNDSTSQYLPSSNETQWIEEADANEDGTAIAAGGSTPGIEVANPEIVDFNLNSMGLIEEHFDAAMPIGTPSFFLHPSGALLYKAGASAVGGSVEIDDLRQWAATATVTFPEPFIASYSPFTDHMLTTDTTGRYLFGVTKSGITMMVLNTIPLSIGNLQPASGQPLGGETVTVRGSGFEAGAAVSFGDTQAATTFVDEDTLTAVVPALTSAWQDVTVKNPDGTSYTAQGIFPVAGSESAPAITGFSPSAMLAESDIPGFDTPQTITALGSGFNNQDTVEINGQPVDSAFIDPGHIQATVPASLTGQTGSLAFKVESAAADFSNTLSLPVVNPVPTIANTSPAIFTTGHPGETNLSVYGTNFVAGSVLRWNGQNLSTYFTQGENTAGQELLSTFLPAALLSNPGTATITVLNPSPGGGTSNSVVLKISSPQPLVSYPANFSFGTVLLDIPTTATLQLMNLGTANYTASSISLSPGPFSIQSTACTNIVPGFFCGIQIMFSSVAVGSANATLTIADNATGSPHTIVVTGTGAQTLIPQATITSIDSLGDTVSATVHGTATVGGSNVPATAWIEYGTDPALATYTKSTSWSFTGDSIISGSITGLSPDTTYAARLAVQTSGGTGKSGIQLFATMSAPALISLDLAPGASNAITVNAGQSATYQLTASDGGNGYTGTAVFSCVSVPTAATCTVSPATLNIGATAAPFTVTIATTAPSSKALSGTISEGLLAVFVFPLSLGAIAFRKRWLRRMSVLTCFMAVAICISSCGGSQSGSGSGGGTGPPVVATPAGTYYVTVNASAGTTQTSYLLTLTVN